MCPQRLNGAVLGVGGEGDVEELPLAPDLCQGAAQAALEVVPGDVVLLRGGGSHDDGVKDDGRIERGKWILSHTHVADECCDIDSEYSDKYFLFLYIVS